MKCEKCGREMKNLGVVPKMGRRVIGKQYFKMQCPNCPEEIKYIKLRQE
jgi:predicted RNA-binding Zn-ribbon protein involved in translation (DUF1610 family)